MDHHSRDDYFAPTVTSSANKPLAHATDATPTKERKPLLLLVEDNEINLRVCRDDVFFLWTITDVREASQHLCREE